MKLWTWITTVEHRGWWGIIGTVVGIAGLYAAFHVRKPALVYAIESQSNVLDVRKPLADLQVSFQGQDVQGQNLNLRVIQLRISNPGEADILQQHFDEIEPWGLQIRGARILEARLTEATSPYLRRNVAPRLISDSIVTFSKVILEKGNSFAVELLIIHNKATDPRLWALGKIAGVEAQVSGPRPSSVASGSSWRELLHGPLWVHLVRLVAYSFIALVIIVAVGLTSMALSERSQKRKAEQRRARIIALVSPESQRQREAAEIIADLYARGGKKALETARKATADPARMLRRAASFARTMHSVRVHPGMIVESSSHGYPEAFLLPHLVGELKEHRFLADTEPPFVAQEVVDALDVALHELEDEGEGRVPPDADEDAPGG